MLRNTTIFAGILVLFCSCKDNADKVLVTTPAFDSVLIAADKSYDAGYKTEPLQMVLHAHANAPKLTIADEMNYFNYCNIRYGNLKNYDRCIVMADSMLTRLGKERKNPKITSWRTVAYNAKADAQFAKGEYANAYDNYFQAQKLARDNQDSCSLRTYAYSLAMVLYKQQRFHEAAHQFIDANNKASACTENFNLFYFRQEILDNIGLCYSALHEYDSAMYYYSLALKFLDDHTGKFEHKAASVYEAPKAVVYGNMAEVFVNTGKYDTAMKLYNKSISINLQKGYANSDALIDQVKLADIYFQASDMPMMKKTLMAIRAELDTIPEQRAEIMWNKLMWKYYNHEKQTVLAYDHLNTYTDKNEAYNAANKTLLATDLDTRVKMLEKQYSINLLTRDKQEQRILLVIITLFAAMACVIMAIVWRNAARSKKNVRLLTGLNNKISEQKDRLELAVHELKEKEKQLIKSANIQDKLFSIIGHDLRSPLSNIPDMLQVLKFDSVPDHQKKHLLNNLLEHSKASVETLDKLLYWGQTQIKGTGINPEVFNASEHVQYSLALVKSNAEKKQITIVDNIPEDIEVYADADHFDFIVRNLLSNAVKFTFNNGYIEITADTDKIDGSVVFMVSDNGMGISDENLAVIFEPFSCSTIGTNNEKGTSIGLTLCKEFVKENGGEIWVESEVGKGSAFYFSFKAVVTAVPADQATYEGGEALN